MNMTEIVEKENMHTVMKTTCKKAKKNFEDGLGDNMWAKGLVLRECMEGQHPAMKNGQELESIFETLKTMDFYDDFMQSEVYNKFYKNDPEFEPVRRFLELCFERDASERQKNFLKINDEKNDFIDVPINLKEELSKYY